jgi:hypothetical protein
MASEDDAAPAAHDENQLQPQRNTDGAQGGTVDCAETTELTCGSTDSAQGGAVGCAVTTEPTATATPVAGSKRKRPKGKKRNTDGAQGGAVDCVETTEPKKKRKRKKKKPNTPTERLKKSRRRETFQAKQA